MGRCLSWSTSSSEKKSKFYDYTGWICSRTFLCSSVWKQGLGVKILGPPLAPPPPPATATLRTKAWRPHRPAELFTHHALGHALPMIPGPHLPLLRATRVLSTRLCPSRHLCSDGFRNGGETPTDTLHSNGGGVREGEEEMTGLNSGHFRPEMFLRLPPLGGPPESDDDDGGNFSPGHGSRRRFFEDVGLEADRIFRILLQDGPGFSARQALDEMRLTVSHTLMREVLFRILVSVDSVNRERYPKLAYRFFVWAGQQEGYRHNTSTYNMVMKVFAQCGEVKAIWRLFEEMAEKGLPVSARTFHLLICASGQIGLRRRLVERFIKSSAFRYRPFRNAFNAILHTLLTIEQYSLIEWVH